MEPKRVLPGTKKGFSSGDRRRTLLERQLSHEKAMISSTQGRPEAIPGDLDKVVTSQQRFDSFSKVRKKLGRYEVQDRRIAGSCWVLWQPV